MLLLRNLKGGVSILNNALIKPGAWIFFFRKFNYSYTQQAVGMAAHTVARLRFDR
jgi:hypothetical protein